MVDSDFFKLFKDCSLTAISLMNVQYSIFKLQFYFINYELDICSFIAFQAFLRRLKKITNPPFVQSALNIAKCTQLCLLLLYTVALRSFAH